ncbi:inosose dehydratase [Fulvitalea axinellae]|uniref:Inosose dehydratase n=1 Tax=Fulvitalea axinellae TaxID=1182444 RepID=A0AAU9CJD8_9BACT|nr:inosose dehydratase [Fulvitalea axinellae]
MALNIQLGIAPIGWTNDDVPSLGGEIPFEQCVSEMALAGFTGCEVGNKYPKDPAVLKKALDLRGLRVANQWFSYTLSTDPFERVREEFEKQLDFLTAMGTKVVGGGECGNGVQCLEVPVLDRKVVFTEDQWKKVTYGLNELGKIARDRGIKLAFHHHMGTGIQSMEEVDRMLDSTDPENVFLNYDCGHFTFAGEDPVMALKKYIGRTAHVHLKDVRPAVLESVKADKKSFLDAVVAGVFTVPGDPDGCIDFPALFDILDQNDYSGWILVEAEQDPAIANPLEYAIIARKYIQQRLDALSLVKSPE